MHVYRASMIFGFTSWVIYVLIWGNDSNLMYLRLFQAKLYVVSLSPLDENKRQWSVNDFESLKSGN